MRRLVAIISILTVVGLVIFLANRKDSTNAPVSGASNSTPIVTAEPTIALVTQPPTRTTAPTVLAERTPSATCSNIFSTTKSIAQKFMTAHKNRSIDDVLSQLSSPVSDDETAQFDFLLGTDTGEEARLYTIAQFSYATKSFKFGTLNDAGADPQNRGARLCSLSVYETRTSTAADTFIEATETQYLVFSFDESGNTTLIAFRNAKNGAKYSGFN